MGGGASTGQNFGDHDQTPQNADDRRASTDAAAAATSQHDPQVHQENQSEVTAEMVGALTASMNLSLTSLSLPGTCDDLKIDAASSLSEAFDPQLCQMV